VGDFRGKAAEDPRLQSLSEGSKIPHLYKRAIKRRANRFHYKGGGGARRKIQAEADLFRLLARSLDLRKGKKISVWGGGGCRRWRRVGGGGVRGPRRLSSGA